MASITKSTGVYQSLASYGDPEFSKFIRRAFLASAGYDETDLDRPIVGIADTSSDYNTCHRQMPEIIEAVKRGVLEAGGLPLVFPTLSLHEILFSPTTMLFRNLLAMTTEEMIRAQPMDSVVLVGGCDKTVPAQLMAAASAEWSGGWNAWSDGSPELEHAATTRAKAATAARRRELERRLIGSPIAYDGAN